jgi:uncharacterized protein HemY
LKFAQKAAEAAPDLPAIQDTLGSIYYRKRVYSLAIQYLKNAADKEPSPRYRYHLGMAYIKAGNQTAGQQMVHDALNRAPELAKTERGW